MKKHRYDDLEKTDFVDPAVGVVWRDKIVKLPGTARIFYTFENGNESELPDSINITFDIDRYDRFDLPVTESVIEFLDDIENKTVRQMLEFFAEYAI
ncbi:hypothetical protein [Rummeliibacillus sp. TYF-LIM-RU47]|uniref:hypothetical protein n=1 Tax=Rummeliibacillus sp. TYF-LIM-RU47 TaxID=2608406 RepID=UPI001239F8E5|nr:hypothetical protein [Rummeliibacillus sp. TYF-LIM-RU47]